jgi:O-antigen ligase
MVVGLGLVAAFSINNRTVWIGFVLQSLLLMALIRHWHARFSSPGSARTLSHLAWGVLLLLCIFAMFTLQRRDGLQGLAGDIRISLWRESITYILEAPWFGHGFGRGSVRAALLAEFNDSLLWHSHNLFLEVVLQTGLIGLAFFLLLLGSLMRAAVRHLRHDTLAVSVLGMVAGMIVLGMLIRNMTDMLWVRAAALTFWGTLGLAFGLAGRSSAANTVVVKP